MSHIPTGIIKVREFDQPIDISKGPLPPLFPLVTEYVPIEAGFGRGSIELGIPTANVPIDKLPSIVNTDKFKPGVYFGYCKLSPLSNNSTEYIKRKNHGSDTDSSHDHMVQFNYGNELTFPEIHEIYPVVLSIGYNVFYGDLKKKTVELHLLHKFTKNFYGCLIKFNILGYIRPELNYTTKENLIKDINIDIDIAQKVLSTDYFAKYKTMVQ
ncbi:related to Riboflavin kinase [Saccharomycodes ludwigii]|uniref:Riboflavin kinase n=1 Tax=Saccharomycodes ludwigii TaxID=36035 RepID=A0A376B8U0_9ASCO|nr:hypothetical protein SCDLUD_001928 [Saccharomycodes ludwigii]KAH3902115.1 hypothetical protein SCDLUD_001928 [Saccharomycodes ludwigii]SSD60540.1 related to Riboflavin kinase [Saccharomycodes ludwigii]